ncbi:MAG TPA: hypothetical protein VFJ82_26220 [Longimicrobium sp.]|nr:hypothetical protein [Longimicrobium sp.]
MKAPVQMQSPPPGHHPAEPVDQSWTEEDEEELQHFREMSRIARQVSREWIDELIRRPE